MIGKELNNMKKAYFNVSKKELLRVQGLCKAFEEIAKIVPGTDFDDYKLCQIKLLQIDDILRKFGEEWGL